MKFAAMLEYITDTAKIARVRPAHRKYLTDLHASGKLLLAGPFGDDSGGIIAYEAATQEEAEALVKNDPFCTEGVMVKWTLKPWRLVFVGALPPAVPPPA